MHRAVARLKVELIILFGFAIGLLILTGFFMDPSYYYPDNVFWPLTAFIENLLPDIYIRVTAGLLLLLLLGLSVKRVYAIGGPGAIIGAVMGFLAGLATPSDLLVGLVMLGIGLACGYIAVTGLRTLKGSWVVRPRG
ncbi:MAG TPA: hypothetical protein VKO45_00395 [Methanomicrobiales archaeon]|nr:hypothetical protein [Methanomicrobiales archaeon]